jgi:death-on-curing protein
MPRRREPRWLTRRLLDAIHDAQIREHGGATGVRDDGLLESALARPQQRWAYAEKSDLATLAAAYVFGLVKNHGYVDGNKRGSFMAAYVFLSMNGYDVDLDEADMAVTIERAAAGRITEVALAEWFREHLKRVDER